MQEADWVDSERHTEGEEWRAEWEEGEEGIQHADRSRRNPYRTCKEHWRSQSHRPRKTHCRASHTTIRKCQEVWAVEEGWEVEESEGGRWVEVASEGEETARGEAEGAEGRGEVQTAEEGREVVGKEEEVWEEGETEETVEGEDVVGVVAVWEGVEGEEEASVRRPYTCLPCRADPWCIRR